MRAHLLFHIQWWNHSLVNFYWNRCLPRLNCSNLFAFNDDIRMQVSRNFITIIDDSRFFILWTGIFIKSVHCFVHRLEVWTIWADSLVMVMKAKEHWKNAHDETSIASLFSLVFVPSANSHFIKIIIIAFFGSLVLAIDVAFLLIVGLLLLSEVWQFLFYQSHW